jgi:hypothetical protein
LRWFPGTARGREALRPGDLHHDPRALQEVARLRTLLQVQPQATRHRLHPDDIRRRVRDHRIERQSAEGAEAEVHDRPVLREAVARRVGPAED